MFLLWVPCTVWFRQRCIEVLCVLCSSFVPASVEAGVAIAVDVVPVEKVSCVSYHPWHDRLLASDGAVVVVL